MTEERVDQIVQSFLLTTAICGIAGLLVLLVMAMVESLLASIYVAVFLAIWAVVFYRITRN